MSAFADFAAGYEFQLDDYQEQACQHVADGLGVLVAAPTGAGKTVVGEFAAFLALRTGRKCFYTTPIKALSNQKYHDLCERHGEAAVGLLTGDTTINGEAPVVVMTTEVLRNMIYAGSPTLANLGFVVMDEVHYLADRFRGAVWEEVILSLAESVQLVALSATVSNAEEFGAWLSEVRGGVEVVVTERRPVGGVTVRGHRRHPGAVARGDGGGGRPGRRQPPPPRPLRQRPAHAGLRLRTVRRRSGAATARQLQAPGVAARRHGRAAGGRGPAASDLLPLLQAGLRHRSRPADELRAAAHHRP